MNNFTIWYEWSEVDGCNVFTSRVSMDPEYSEMYASFNDSPAERDGSRKRAKYRSQCSIASDFPMDHFAFFLEEDEKRFVEEYMPYLEIVKSSPPKNWVRPANPEGIKWCDRCLVFHKVRDPNLPPLEEELISRMAAEITKEIDNSFLESLLKFAREN